MNSEQKNQQDEACRIISRGLLRPVFQPIIDFRIRGVLGYEALIRGPADSPLHFPAELFAAARSAGLSAELEHAAREISLREFALAGLPGRIFLNVTPGILFHDEWVSGATQRLLSDLGIAENRVVIELTENEEITSMPELRDILQHLRGRGFQIAIDDLGEGFANLRMWSEVRPEFVKIDRHFANGIANDRMKYHFVRAMQDLAESCAATLIAEGIERVEDFDCVRSMGIACAQGYYIARPSLATASTVSAAVQVLLREPALSVPPLRTQGAMTRTAAELARPVTPVPADATNDQVLARFADDSALDVLPVVCAGQPVGLINRESMIDRFARTFRKALYGRHSCQQFMDPAPLIADERATLQELAMMLARAPRRHLLDGFVVTREGRYLGVGGSRDLMAAITEMQISAARYANPLTQLPGNVPINEQIDRHLASSNPFVAVYVDIDSFKPFNDTFGYRRGDDVILMLAKLLCEHVDDGRDYVGHIGGDDFFIVFQSRDWEQRCLDVLHCFSEAIAAMIGTDGCPLSSYMAENRHGELVLQQLPTLSIGAVKVGAGEFESHREVAAAASDARKQAKKEAKRSPGQTSNSGRLFVERRQPGTRRLTDSAPPLFN